LLNNQSTKTKWMSKLINELVDVGCEKLGTRWRFELNYLLLTIKSKWD